MSVRGKDFVKISSGKVLHKTNVASSTPGEDPEEWCTLWGGGVTQNAVWYVVKNYAKPDSTRTAPPQAQLVRARTFLRVVRHRAPLGVNCIGLRTC